MGTSERRGETGRVQAGERIRDWCLLDGNRLVVTGTVATSLFLAVAFFSLSGLVPYREVQPLFYLFSSLLGGNLTLITVVVSINQLLLSQELDTPGGLRSEIDGAFGYREGVESDTGQVPPGKPRGFLRFLYADLRELSRRVDDLAAPTDRRLEDVLVELGTSAASNYNVLSESNASTFDVLSTTLTTNFAGEVRRLKRVKSEHDLSREVEVGIDDIVERLEHVEVARHYFKSVYFKEELAGLSQLLFFVGFPSIVALGAGLLLLTGGHETVLTPLQLSLVASGVFALGLFPLCVLFSYVVRVSAVTRRTAARLPFTTPDQER